MVEDIEEFSAELEVTRSAELCLLQHGEIHIAKIRPVDDIAAAIAKRPRGRHGERRRVEPVGNGLRMRIRINASDAIRPLVDEIAVPEGVRPDVDRIGDACAQDSERRDPPPREQLAAEARAKKPMARTERYVIQEVEGKVLADVAGAVAFLGFYVVEVLGVGSGNRRIFHIVNRVAEGVVCLEAQTGPASAANKGELQSVVRAEARVRLERNVAEVRVRTSTDRWIEVVDALFAPQIHAMVAYVGDLE